MTPNQRSKIWCACAFVFVASASALRAQTDPGTPSGAAPAPKESPPVARPAQGTPPPVEREPKTEPAPNVEPAPTIDVSAPHAATDPHEEMERLFGEVERKLIRVNRLLEEASVGGKRGAAAANGMKSTVKSIDELLRESEESGRASVAAIDRILELASQPHDESSGSSSKTGGLCQSAGSGKSGGSQSGQAPGSKPKSGAGQNGKQPGGEQSGDAPSPLDRQGTATSQREATPQGPGEGQREPGADKPGSDPHDANAQGQQPKGNRATQTPGRLRPGETPPGAATETVGVAPSGQERWGELPETTREIFRMQGGGDMPPRYREWIDAYYKRLNQKP